MKKADELLERGIEKLSRTHSKHYRKPLPSPLRVSGECPMEADELLERVIEKLSRTHSKYYRKPLPSPLRVSGECPMTAASYMRISTKFRMMVLIVIMHLLRLSIAMSLVT